MMQSLFTYDSTWMREQRQPCWCISLGKKAKLSWSLKIFTSELKMLLSALWWIMMPLRKWLSHSLICPWVIFIPPVTDQPLVVLLVTTLSVPLCMWVSGGGISCQQLLSLSRLQVHGQPADRGAWDRVPLLLQRPAHHQRGRLCTDPPSLHQRGRRQRVFGERAPQHAGRKGALYFFPPSDSLCHHVTCDSSHSAS